MSLHVPQAQGLCSTKGDANGKYGPWVITTCRRRFIDCNKWTALVGDVGGRESCVCGVRACLGTLYFLLNFAESKTCLKNKVYLEKKRCPTIWKKDLRCIRESVYPRAMITFYPVP